MLLHQSTLQSWQRCPQEVGLILAGKPDKPNSATVYGSVMHHALHVLERERDLDKALATFEYYWHPKHQAEIAGEAVPPDGWLPRQSWGRLKSRGKATLIKYWDQLKWQEHELLALEYEFIVPIPGTPHHLGGTMDRLSVRWDKRKMFLGVDDNKTGQQKWGLRHNVQGTAYSYATTFPEFWVGWQGEIVTPTGQVLQVDTRQDSFGAERGAALFERFIDVPRRFTWINIHEGSFRDGGYRGEKDYRRFVQAVSQVAASIEAGIFPLNISGETCAFCQLRDSCGAVEEDVDAGLHVGQGGTRLNPRRSY